MIELILSGYLFVGAIYLIGKVNEEMDLSEADLPSKIGLVLYLISYWAFSTLV